MLFLRVILLVYLRSNTIINAQTTPWPDYNTQYVQSNEAYTINATKRIVLNFIFNNTLIRDIDINIYGGTGDADLYTRYGVEVDFSNNIFDCAPWAMDNNETCIYRPASVGQYYITIHAYQTFANVKFIITASDGGDVEDDGPKPSCFVCANNEDCGGFDICLTTSSPSYKCVECAVDANCVVRYNNTEKTNLAVCDQSTYECVECEEDNDCTDAICGSNSTCVDCNVDGDCASGFCLNYECVGCKIDADCTEEEVNTYCDGDNECDYTCEHALNGTDCSEENGECVVDRYPGGCVDNYCRNDTICEDDEGPHWYCSVYGVDLFGRASGDRCRPRWCGNSLFGPLGYCMGIHYLVWEFTIWSSDSEESPYAICDFETGYCGQMRCDPTYWPCSEYDDYFNATSGGTITTNPYSFCGYYNPIQDQYYCKKPCSAYNNTWCVKETSMQTYSCLGDVCGEKFCDNTADCGDGMDCNSKGVCVYNCEDDVLGYYDNGGCSYFSEYKSNYFCQDNGTDTCEPDQCATKDDCQDGFTCDEGEGECVKACTDDTWCGENGYDIQYSCNSTSGFCYFDPSAGDTSTGCHLEYGRADGIYECDVREFGSMDDSKPPNFKCLYDFYDNHLYTCVFNDNCDYYNTTSDEADDYCSGKYNNEYFECGASGNCNLIPAYDCAVSGCGWAINMAVTEGKYCAGFPVQVPCINHECSFDDMPVECTDNGDCDDGYVCSTLQSAKWAYINMRACVLECTGDDYCDSLFCSAGEFGEESDFTIKVDDDFVCDDTFPITCDANTKQCVFADECQEDADCILRDGIQEKCLVLPFRPNMCYIDCAVSVDVCESAYSGYFKNAADIECTNIEEGIELSYCDVFSDEFDKETFPPTMTPTVTLVDEISTTSDDAADGINILSIFGAITITIFIKSFM